MDHVFRDLLILLVVIWSVAVVFRHIGLPTIMGELMMGVLLGPAVFGWVELNEIIEVLANLGIFFLLLHTGVETSPREFFAALKKSIGVATVGAMVPFGVSFGVAIAFGLDVVPAIFVGLTMTATAVVITLKILYDLGLKDTRVARVVVASCVIDDLMALVAFSFVIGIIQHGDVDALALGWIALKVALFFGGGLAIGYWGFPLLKHPFRNRDGHGFTFVLVLGLAYGLVAEAIGLHIILGAYLAGLFFEEKVASRELVQKVTDRLEGIAYSFLGPIFFISLGFHITFDALKGEGLALVASLTTVLLVGQIVSAGSMARLLKFSWLESVSVGVGMCGRAEMAYVIAALGFKLGAFDANVLSAMIFVTFLVNIFTSIGLKLCAPGLHKLGANNANLLFSDEVLSGKSEAGEAKPQAGVAE
jgi:Kef-type K+ transport system membrane component KefB